MVPSARREEYMSCVTDSAYRIGHVHSVHDKTGGSAKGWAEEAVALSVMKAREGSSSDSGGGMGVVYILESQHLSS